MPLNDLTWTMEPLVFAGGNPLVVDVASGIDQTLCLLCDESCHVEPESYDLFLKHLLDVHQLVIAEVDTVADMKKYVEFWRPRLRSTPLEKVCIKMAAQGTHQFYYMLCSFLPDDKYIRNKLMQERLQSILQDQQLEREDNSSQFKCLFCGEIFNGNRSLVLNHMNTEHNFNIGHPDNLVHVSDMLRLLHSKLERLLCLYCEKTFKDKFTLKEHMRKKMHKRLNPKNTEYDKYYLINYAIDKDVKSKKFTVQKGRGGVVAHITGPDSDAEDDWLDCEDPVALSQMSVICLFCSFSSCDSRSVFKHMKETHNFDMDAIRRRHRLTFYDQVKVVNYIRRQVYNLQCVACTVVHEGMEALVTHMETSGHVKEFLENRKTWDQPEYYFPTYENDNLLTSLDSDDLKTDDWIIPEDFPNLDRSKMDELVLLLQEELSTQERPDRTGVVSSNGLRNSRT